MRAVLLCCALAATALPGHALAQAGPPLITNDAGTPGPGKWEINLAAVGSKPGGQWSLAAPDADINYGVGDRIQLSVHAAWEHASYAGGSVASGLGATEYALRWRFADADITGVDAAIQPHIALPGSRAAIDKGLSQPHREIVLPLQIVRPIGASVVGIEIAKHWMDREPDAFQVGAFWARDCAPGWQCLAEINASRTDGGATDSFAGVGIRRVVSKRLRIMAAFEKQVDGASGTRADFIYFGVQLTP